MDVKLVRDCNIFHDRQAQPSRGDKLESRVKELNYQLGCVVFENCQIFRQRFNNGGNMSSAGLSSVCHIVY